MIKKIALLTTERLLLVEKDDCLMRKMLWVKWKTIPLKGLGKLKTQDQQNRAGLRPQILSINLL